MQFLKEVVPVEALKSPLVERPPVRADDVKRRVRLPNGAVRVETYSLAGRLRSVEEPDGSFLRFRYDADGRITGVAHSSLPGAAYHHENEGRRIRAVLGRVETAIDLNEDGLPEKIVQRMDGHEWTVEYRHDAQGRVRDILYPQSRAWLRFRNTRKNRGAIALAMELGDAVLAESVFDAQQKSTEISCANGAVMGEDLSTGEKPGLTRIWHKDANGFTYSTSYSHDAAGRIVHAGNQRFEYDDSRLVGSSADAHSTSYRYDGSGRLAAVRHGEVERTLRYGSGPLVQGVDGRCDFSYDAVGRRTARLDGRGETRYVWNLFGQLDSVTLPGGETILYHYDGFGRLVARETADGIHYYVVGFDGHRLAEAGTDGVLTRRYLWLAQNCIGWLENDTLTTLHRIHGGRLAFVQAGISGFQPQPLGDPYGDGGVVDERVPSLASLFGDSNTGLLFAGSRWFDPEIAQFLSADSWCGTDAWNHLPRGMRRTLDALPGGTDFSADPLAAYNWCGFDPINRTDPNGHNPLGLIWSCISAFFWQMQVTSVALQMELINILLNILLLPFSFLYWDFYTKISIFNAIPPLVASSRLMVPFAFPLNGIFNASGSVFTMGAVIWANGDQLRNLENTSQRDLLICSNADQYLASTDAAASDTFRVRHPSTKGTATVSADGKTLNSVTMDAAAGGVALANAFAFGDWVAVRLPGGQDEIRQVFSVSATLNLLVRPIDPLPPLSAALQGQNVEFRRLDSSIVRLEKDGRTICRTITFVRGQAMHYSQQIPEVFPASGLNVAEYLPAVRTDITSAAATPEAILVRLASAAHQNDFAVDDFVRLRNSTNYFGRRVTKRQGSTDLLLDAALPALTAPAAYDPLEIVKMNADATANNQASSTDRVDAGTITGLKKFDGLTVTAGGTTDRRIVLQVFVRCPIAALPNTLQAVNLTAELVVPGAQAQGAVASANTITATAGQGSRIQAHRPVRVRTGASTDFLTTVASVNGDTITLDENLPAAFPATTAVSVTLLGTSNRFDADPSPSPGDKVLVSVDDATSPAQNDILFVLPRGATTGGAVRQVNAATTVVARVDSNPSSAASLTVQRFIPVAATLHGDAKAPLVQLHLTFTGAAPFVVNDEVHLSRGEEGYGKIAAVNGSVLTLEDPIEVPGLGASPAFRVTVQRITPTTHTTANANLDESLIMIPSDMDEDLVDRRRAVELHEMRHVWQYSVLGPFFFSQPIPWLFNLGFSIGSEGAGNAAHNLTKWISLGLFDKFFAVVAWGVGALFGAAPASGSGNGHVGADRKTIVFDTETPEATLDAFTGDSPAQIAPATGDSIFNIIDSLDKPNRTVHLRFTMEGDSFAPDARVSASVSAFDKIDSTVNKYFSLNLERLWSDYIPTAWGRALSGLLNRENWFPGIGFYLLSLYCAGMDQSKVNFEQDASFESGDIYNPFTISDPAEIFVGQFSRVHAFVYGRGAGDTDAGLSSLTNIVDSLTVAPPSPLPSGLQPQNVVFGSRPAQNLADRVRFSDNYLIPMKDKAANVLGALFAASVPGDYRLHTPGEVDSVQRMLFFSADFVELRNVKVKALGVSPVFSNTTPIFETEQVTLTITGDPAATYAIRYKGATPTTALTISGLQLSAPVLPSNANVTQNLEFTATYPATAAVFHGKGQQGDVRLTADQRTNACQDLTFDIAPIAVTGLPASVQAGSSTTFTASIAPVSANVTSARPADATVNASVQIGTGRPATLTFHAPDHVTANATVTFNLVFGSAATKTVPLSVTITPGP